MNLQFVTQIPEFQLDNKKVYRDVLMRCAAEEDKYIRNITYYFVGEKEILSINRDFLDHDYVTDIITFDNSFLQTIEGEIFICIPEVIRNANFHSGGNFLSELNRVILHGILHLIGYRDDSDDARRLMREKESYYLQYFN